jgi:uncharacterized protein (TIGR02145 family)
MKLILLLFATLVICQSTFCQPPSYVSKKAESVFIDKRDNKEYKTVTIGTQVWLAENFAYLPMVDTVNVSVYGYKGSSINKAKASVSYQKYGALYSWEYANKLAPEGWHLPTDADWLQLEKNLGIPQEIVNTIGWRGPNNEANKLKPDGNTGFLVVFGGWRTDYGKFNFQDEHANFWCADSFDNERAFERLVGVRNGRVGREYGNKGCGFSVRYVRNMAADEATTIPGKSWENIEKKEVYGWNTGKLNSLYDFVKDSTNATGVVVIQSGKLLFDYGNTEELSYIASCRKSILSMLYGKYIEEGKIDLKKTIGELGVDDIGGLLPIEKTATVLDLIQSRSDVYHDAGNSGGNDFLFTKRGSVKPGTHYIYNNWDFNAAGYVFEKRTGLDIHTAFEKDIATKIGLEDWDKKKQFRSGDTTKSKFTAYHFMFSTRDMARIGYLLLRYGRWKDEQVIPENWVKQMTSITTSFEEMKLADPRLKDWPWYPWGYGLMWRIWDSPAQKPELKRAYTATGNMGQYITVIPSQDIVIALKTKSDYGRSTEYEDYLSFINKIIDAKR